MPVIFVIAAKDLRIYLTTWTSYILVGAFILVSSFFFQALIGEYQTMALQYAQSQTPWMADQMNLTDWVMGNLFRNIVVFFLFMLPILTMRLLAEEKKSKTLELLFTTPVRPLDIVLGKYLAALSILVIMLLFTLVFPILLTIYGKASAGVSILDWHTVWVGYLGMFLMGAAFVSVGLFASSLTESQIVAVVVSFAILLIFFVIGFSGADTQTGWQVVTRYLSLTGHFEDFVRGIVNTSALIYYISIVFLGLFFSYRVVEAHRWR
ncbi:ABC transporter permease subunit [Myxococcota bacterium]|nr:ABC transporter permease subunit [Myxococcota bacterium]